MQDFSIVKELSNFVDNCRLLKKTIGFVPTMGYLHEGHLSLMRQAKKENEVVVVSIYVNPTQFAPHEDFLKYPRDLNHDKQLLEKIGVDVLFTPTDQEMYGLTGNNLHCRRAGIKGQKLSYCEDRFLVKPPDYLLNCLCGKSRVGHFEGVALVVSKLFHMVRPHKAYFGQKDYQQALILKKLVSDLSFGVEVVICPTVREPDGLAMSSRNVYLNEEERRVALVLYRGLKISEQKLTLLRQGYGGQAEVSKSEQGVQGVQEIVQQCSEMIRQESLVELEYFEILQADTLQEAKKLVTGQKLLIAGAIKIGKTRLIDNVLVTSL